jgi:hypothetical protein
MIAVVSVAAFVAANACLLHPEPQLRPMATDRPTLTFNPTTVDAGHLQLETDVALGAYDGTTSALVLGGSTLRIGVSPDADLQLTFPTLAFSGTDLFTDAATTSISRGAFALRLKWNLVGNDGGVAVAVIPAVAIGADDVVTGSVIVPFSVGLPADFTLGAMAQVDVYKPDDAVDGRGLVTVVVSHALFDAVTGYFEAQADARTNVAAGDDVTTNFIGSAGAAWLVTDNLQADLGMRVPLVGTAPTLEVFVGVSIRR